MRWTADAVASSIVINPDAQRIMLGLLGGPVSRTTWLMQRRGSAGLILWPKGNMHGSGFADGVD